MKEANNIIKDTKLQIETQSQSYVICTQSLALLWKSYSFTDISKEDKTQKYIRIKSLINIATYQSYSIIMLPTDDDKITAFFILSCKHVI